MKRKIMRGLTAVFLASAFLASPVLGATVENLLVTKIESTNTLKLEDGISVKVQDSTEIRDEHGERITFADIPDPATTQGAVMLRVDGSSVSGTIRASKVKVHKILRD